MPPSKATGSCLWGNADRAPARACGILVHVQRVRFGVIGVGGGRIQDAQPGLAIRPHRGRRRFRRQRRGRRAAGRGAAAAPPSPTTATCWPRPVPRRCAVLAPHPFHAALTMDAWPLARTCWSKNRWPSQVAEADQMIEAAERAGRLLAVNLQHRTRSEIRTADRLIQSGRLGDIQRVEMVAIWTRTASYYAQAGWRGTWQGEGGGVLDEPVAAQPRPGLPPGGSARSRRRLEPHPVPRHRDRGHVGGHARVAE